VPAPALPLPACGTSPPPSTHPGWAARTEQAVVVGEVVGEGEGFDLVVGGGPG
jgi:hypothetical protein